MAALALSLLGGGISSSLGFGGGIGSAIGGLIGSALFGPKAPTIKGPRLQDLRLQSSAFGDPKPRLWASNRVAAQLVWTSGLKEHKRKVKVGGKGFGGGGATGVTFFYTVDMRMIFAANVSKGIRKMWFDSKLVYDVGDAPPSGELIQKITASNLVADSITVYTGGEAQLPDPLEESYMGVGVAPAYRGDTSIVFDDLNLEKFQNRIPNISAEVFTEGVPDTIKEIGRHDIDQGNFRSTFLHVDGNGELLAFVIDAAQPFDDYPDDSWFLHRVTPSSISRERKIPTAESELTSALLIGPLTGHSDEPSYALSGSGSGIHYFSWADQAGIRLPIPPGFATFVPRVFAKKGDEFLVLSHGPASTADHSLILYRNQVPVLTTLQYDTAGENIRDVGITDDFFYIITGDEGNASIQRLNKGDFSTVQTWALGQNFVQKMDVKSDDLIYFFRQELNEGPISFFKLEDGVVSSLGSVTQSQVTTPGFNRFGFAFTNGIFYYQNRGEAGGNVNIFLFAPTAVAAKILLSQIVSDLCVEAGLSTDQIDVTELTDLVCGYARAKQMTARDAIEKLQEVYFFDGVLSDGKLKFPKRGKAAVVTIPEDDLAAHEFSQEMPAVMTSTIGKEKGLPQKVFINYINQEADYQQGHQEAERLITDSKNIVTVESPVVLANDEARQVANILLATMGLEKTTYEIRLGNKYAHLDPADVIKVTLPA